MSKEKQKTTKIQGWTYLIFFQEGSYISTTMESSSSYIQTVTRSKYNDVKLGGIISQFFDGYVSNLSRCVEQDQ